MRVESCSLARLNASVLDSGYLLRVKSERIIVGCRLWFGLSEKNVKSENMWLQKHSLAVRICLFVVYYSC